MLFTHSQPPKRYKDYRLYRSLLRKDFRYRCAYCLRQEFYLGGREGCCIDHHHPVHGPSGKPLLECEYTNLYWVCRACNEYKADQWPTESEQRQGLRFLDPCLATDDHDLHWQTLPDGSLLPLTPIGSFTIGILRLDRDALKHWRSQMFALQRQAQLIHQLLERQFPSEQKQYLELQLQEILIWLEPPHFD